MKKYHNKIYPGETKKRRHKGRPHKDPTSTEYVCGKCKKGFVSNNSLMQHVKNLKIHTYIPVDTITKHMKKGYISKKVDKQIS